MVVLAVLALAAAQAAEPAPPAPPVGAERQAVALVRILPGAPVRFSKLERTDPDSFADARISGPDGSPHPARLIEFH
ncbi:MAG: hypothetical protein H0V46_05745 [Sphingomonas sp.]|nr:hypothetical protein [Sphingomonas sp.]